jgi:hypothetical protein
MPTTRCFDLLVYLCILPLAVGAIFLEKGQPSLIVIMFCSMIISPRAVSIGASNLSQSIRNFMLRFCCLCHPRYMQQREALQNRSAA